MSFNVIIGNEEFDEEFFVDSSKEWNKNKKKHKIFEYKCCWIHKTGQRCKRSTIISKKTNPYNYTMGENKTNYSKNCDVCCKRHINRPYCEEIHKF